MSQLILDEHVNVRTVFQKLRRWIAVEFLHDLCPRQLVLDDRVPEILSRLKQPTFITIDAHFDDPSLCNPNYCILYFALHDKEQPLIPALLRALFRRPEFRTWAKRMGKLARISTASIEYWQFPERERRLVLWNPIRRKR